MIYQEKRLYFYIQDDKLIIKLFGLKDDGKLNTELKLGHPCLALDEAVINAWEPVLLAKKLRTLALVPAGISQLNGKEYYKFNQDIPAGMFNKVKQFYEDFGTEGNMQGLLTCYPDQVKTILKI
jgi:hypothetical protein